MGDPTCDWSCHSPSFLLGWGLPMAALGLSSALASAWIPVVWPLAFVWMSVACAVNAARCGRVHCYFTGAFFFVMAGLSAVHGFGLLDLGGMAWSWISLTALVGGVGLTVVPEMIWGRYRGDRADPQPPSTSPRG